MPHYRNGREAKVGDRVVSKDWAGNPVAGIVGNVMEGSQSCNLTVFQTRQQDALTMTAGDCLHFEDAWPADKVAVVELPPSTQEAATSDETQLRPLAAVQDWSKTNPAAKPIPDGHNASEFAGN